ncbi:hypothetical protein LCGC14_0473870 [marine sediment metagenome]|uniref:GTP-binding protein n=1 Tax=marine sediment metagenome TaxID=412755 RepID=A0A0F9SU82_9ZZZZ|nr:GTP-binding protein [bacterium]
MVEYAFTKVLVFSDTRVGVKTFITRYCNAYPENYKPTLGVNIFTLDIKTRKGEKVSIYFWDVAETPIWDSLKPIYYQLADAAVILYDITNVESIARITERCLKIRESSGDIPLMLLGNKVDIEDKREVSKEQGIEIQNRHNISFFEEVSFNTGENVNDALEEFTRIIIDHYRLNRGE